jgi:hypothetical protein
VAGDGLEREGATLYFDGDYAGAAGRYERAYAAYRRAGQVAGAARAARTLGWISGAALHDALTGARPYDVAMKDYRSARDAAVLPMYEFTTELARLQPPTPEFAAALGAMAGDRAAMDGFVRVTAGVDSPAALFGKTG